MQSFDPDGQVLSFLWDFGDGTTSSEAEATHTYSKAGTYEVKITVTETSSPFASSRDTFTVRSGLTAPVAKITSPKDGTLYEIGAPISFSGTASTDTPDKLSLTWSILQIHNQHSHLVAEPEGASGSFVPVEHSDNTAYELCLTASVGEGLTDRTCVRLPPRTTPYVFQSEPSGATFTYLDEELDVTTPYIARPIVGSEQSIRAPKIYAGQTFSSWEDGQQNLARSFKTGRAPTTLKALYKNIAPKAVVVQGALKNAKKKRMILLDASVSSDPEGSPLSYTWRFSDGKRYSQAIVRRNFSKNGSYKVNLVVKDALGGETPIRRTITVTKRGGARLR